MNDALHNFLGYISNTKIAGIIPLDNVVHFLVGTIVTIIAIKFGNSLKKSTLIVIVLSLGKEIFDSFSLTNELGENIEDFLVTVAYPVLLFFARKLKSKLTEIDEKIEAKDDND